MNLDNFFVRQRRRAVEKYREPDAWKAIDDEKREELVKEVAPLPSAQHRGSKAFRSTDGLCRTLRSP
jgi:type I restriction enzyme R subunit